ncbi:MAG: ABC transporter ATP-binding protein [Sulfurovaceae bacterium]|nr:ABC transporter ATP-binding protein [Sulfurovaceae bacterium]MDD5548054.1 ABC transporter ATP-binding protein [Sulfurovaceae bacterium]
MQLIKAKDISHSFDYELFKNIDFELNSSGSIAIIGKSGSGKSTLLHILSSFLKPKSGSVVLLGKDIAKLNESEIDEMRRFDLGMIFQFHHLFKGMKAKENIEISSMLSNTKVDEKIMKLLEIDSLMEQKTSELSGGQQQRISIARVLAKKPKIIFADEPTGNLDKETAALVMKALKDYIKEENAGLILVTHDKDVASMCDEVYELENQKLSQIR